MDAFKGFALSELGLNGNRYDDVMPKHGKYKADNCPNYELEETN